MTITRQTGITIGLAITVVVTGVGGAWWFGQWTANDHSWKEGTDRRLKSIEESLEESIDGSSYNLLRWTSRLRDENAALGLKVPVPYLDVVKRK